MLCDNSDSSYLPLGNYYFIHPSLGLHGQPLSTKSIYNDLNDSNAHSETNIFGLNKERSRLLRRLDVSWAVLPLFTQLHDVRASYCSSLRAAAGLSPQHPDMYDSQYYGRFSEIHSNDPYSSALAAAVISATASSSNGWTSTSPFMIAQREERRKSQQQRMKLHGEKVVRQKESQIEARSFKDKKGQSYDEEVGHYEIDKWQGFQQPSKETKTMPRLVSRRANSFHDRGNGTVSIRTEEQNSRSLAHDSNRAEENMQRSRDRQQESPTKIEQEQSMHDSRGSAKKSTEVEEELVDGEDDKSEELTAFLALAKLSHVEDRLREEGYEEVDDFTEANDKDLAECGLKKPEIKRLRRYLPNRN